MKTIKITLNDKQINEIRKGHNITFKIQIKQNYLNSIIYKIKIGIANFVVDFFTSKDSKTNSK